MKILSFISPSYLHFSDYSIFPALYVLPCCKLCCKSYLGWLVHSFITFGSFTMETLVLVLHYNCTRNSKNHFNAFPIIIFWQTVTGLMLHTPGKCIPSIIAYLRDYIPMVKTLYFSILYMLRQLQRHQAISTRSHSIGHRGLDLLQENGHMRQ